MYMEENIFWRYYENCKQMTQFGSWYALKRYSVKIIAYSCLCNGIKIKLQRTN